MAEADEAAFTAVGKRVVRVGDKCFIYSNETLKTTPAFETTQIPITEITIVDGRLHSFKFVGTTWYGNPPSGITDKGITGKVDLKKYTAEWTAKYEEDAKDVIAIYAVTGKLKN